MYIEEIGLEDGKKLNASSIVWERNNCRFSIFF